jgi:hypothetical protein
MVAFENNTDRAMPPGSMKLVPASRPHQTPDTALVAEEIYPTRKAGSRSGKPDFEVGPCGKPVSGDHSTQ